MKPEHEAVMQRVRRSRLDLLANNPFFGDLAFNMDIELDDTLNPPTAATDGEGLYYHPDFVTSLTDKQLTFVTGHEILHAALMHLDRRGDRTPQRFNVAADIVCNQILVDNNVGDMPENMIYDPRLYHRGSGILHKIYDLLPEDDPRQSFDDFKPGKPGKKSNPAKMRGKIHQAMEAAKAAGNMSGSLEGLIEQATTPKVRWEDELFSELITCKGDDRTYAKRNRRYAALDVLIPGRYGEKTGDLVFAIDCSGSTSDAMVGQCAAEIQRAKDALRPERTHVLYFDSAIKKHDIYEADDELDVQVYGRGGTAFSPIFKYIEENGIEPQHVIVATDLYCDDYGPEPDYPVIWCVMDSEADNAPWGRTIQTGMVNGEGDCW